MAERDLLDPVVSKVIRFSQEGVCCASIALAISPATKLRIVPTSPCPRVTRANAATPPLANLPGCRVLADELWVYNSVITQTVIEICALGLGYVVEEVKVFPE